MKKQRLTDLIRVVRALALLFSAAGVGPVWSATFVVFNTNDSGDGSLRQAIATANLTANVPDEIHFSILGAGPHTISPATPLPALTDPVVIDGYSQPGASANTLAQGDNAVVQILLLESLVIDTTNSAVRGLAIRQIQVGATTGPKGSNVIEGCFIGLDTTGTNSLASPGFGVLVQTPNNRIGGTNPGARNVISGKGATGIEIFEVFATNNVVQGNFIGTDRTGTRAIGNTDRAVAVNMNASATLIGGMVAGAGNVISGNLNRGITLDGSSNVVQGNFIGTTVTGQPLGNARTGIEIGGVNNNVGGFQSGSGNVIAFNGVDGGGFFTTNGVDVKPIATFYTIAGNSIFDNMGRGIDVKADNLITAGFPVLTLVSNTSTTTLIQGTHMPNAFMVLELFTTPAPDPSGYGEGKTLLVSTNVNTDGAGNFSLNWPTPLAPGLFVTATANGNTEFSEARMVTVPVGPNSWINNESGRWEDAANWSLNLPPFSGHTPVSITNAGTKTVHNDATTAAGFSSTLTISNLVIGAPSGATNTLLLAHGGTSTPLRILRSLTLHSGGALVIKDAALRLEGPQGAASRIDGELTLEDGSLIVTNNVQFYIGNNGDGSLTVSNGMFRVYYPIVGINAGANGTWHIAGGTNIVTTVFDIADNLTATGTVRMTGGLLSVPGAYVGLFGNGRMFVSNGVFLCAGQVLVASQPGAQGIFTATGGTNIFGRMLIGESSMATGAVLVAGNALVQVNGDVDNCGTVTVAGGELNVLTDLNIGGLFNPAVGQMTLSNGTTQARQVFVGGQVGGNGTVRMEGGTLLASNLEVNANSQFIFNRGTLQTHSSSNHPPFVVGDGASPAVYQLAGGTNSFPKGLRIANNATLGGTGTLIGGVTNSGVIAPGTSAGRLDITGSLLLSNSSVLRLELGGYTAGTQFDLITVSGGVTLGGTLAVSLSNNFQSVMTNGASFTVLTAGTPFAGALANVSSGSLLTTTDGYARFTVLYAGATTLRLTNLVVVDTDSDGLPDWWEDLYNLNKNNPADAALDLDGDGASNATEFGAGTLPNNASSLFRIVAVQRETDNLRITWTTVGGKSYRIQTNAPSVNGSFTNNFADLSDLISVTGMGESTTNYLHSNGGLTNGPARYYRVRLEP